MMTNNKIVLKGLLLNELEDYFVSIGEQRYRAKQIFNWLYNHIIFNAEEIKNFPKDLREKIAENCQLKTLELIETQKSYTTLTQKFLFSTNDNKKIETVLIPDSNRNTLCISTQVGCPLDCKFCATGLMGYKRNLTTGEIVDQYLLTAKEYGKEKITNIVLWGWVNPY